MEMHAAPDSTVWIDSRGYPHILYRILQYASTSVLRSFRQTSTEWRERTDRLLNDHLHIESQKASDRISYSTMTVRHTMTVLHDGMRIRFKKTYVKDIMTRSNGPPDQCFPPWPSTLVRDLSTLRTLDIRGRVWISLLSNLPFPRLNTLRMMDRAWGSENLPADWWSSRDVARPRMGYGDILFTPHGLLPLYASRVVVFDLSMGMWELDSFPQACPPWLKLVPCYPAGVEHLVINLTNQLSRPWPTMMHLRMHMDRIPFYPPPGRGSLRDVTIIMAEPPPEAPPQYVQAPLPADVYTQLGEAIEALGVNALIVGLDTYAARKGDAFESARAALVASTSMRLSFASAEVYKDSIGFDDWELFTRTGPYTVSNAVYKGYGPELPLDQPFKVYIVDEDADG